MIEIKFEFPAKKNVAQESKPEFNIQPVKAIQSSDYCSI